MDLVTAIYEPEDLRYPGVQMVLPKSSFESDYDDIFSEFNHLPTVTTEPENTPYVMGDIDFSHYNPFKGKKKSDSVRNTPAEGDIPKTITEKAIYLMTRLQNELGLTKEQAAGITGNIFIESDKKFNPKAVGDDGEAHGIAQWHPDRRKGLDILNMSYEDQVSYLIKELQTEQTFNTYGGLNKLRQMKTASEAAEFIDKAYERSSGEHRAQRKSYAEVYAKLKMLRGGKL